MVAPSRNEVFCSGRIAGLFDRWVRSKEKSWTSRWEIYFWELPKYYRTVHALWKNRCIISIELSSQIFIFEPLYPVLSAVDDMNNHLGQRLGHLSHSFFTATPIGVISCLICLFFPGLRHARSSHSSTLGWHKSPILGWNTAYIWTHVKLLQIFVDLYLATQKKWYVVLLLCILTTGLNSRQKILR